MRHTSAHARGGGGGGSGEFHDWYRVLDVPETATAADVRRGYHKSILRCHPDKALQQNGESGGRNTAAAAATTEEASLVLRAWEALRDPEARRCYDALLRENKLKQYGPVVVHSDVDLDNMNYDTSRATFSHACGCGGRYSVAETDLELASDLGAVIVGCDRCSLRVNVLFAVDEEG